MSSDNTIEVSKEEALHLDNLKQFLYEHNLIQDIKNNINIKTIFWWIFKSHVFIIH